MKELLNAIANFDPQTISEHTSEELAELHDALKQVIGVFTVMQKEIGAELLTRFDGNGTVYGQYSVTRVPTYSYSEVTMEVARSLGAVIVTKDSTILTKLIKKGVSINGAKVGESCRVSSLTKSENEQEGV